MNGLYEEMTDKPVRDVIATPLWLRVRARILDARTFDYTDGQLADVTDAACRGLIEHVLSNEAKGLQARWYASEVMKAMQP